MKTTIDWIASQSEQCKQKLVSGEAGVYDVEMLSRYEPTKRRYDANGSGKPDFRAVVKELSGHITPEFYAAHRTELDELNWLITLVAQNKRAKECKR